MNSAQKASRDILVALMIEANRNLSDIPDLEDLRSRYHLKISDILLASSIAPWEDRGLLIVARSFDETSACIRPDQYGSALSVLLDLLDATIFEVSWKREEILTDAPTPPELPSPNGWKLLQVEREDTESATSHPALQAAAGGIHIHNTFLPTNTVSPAWHTTDGASGKSAAWASWINVLVAAVVGVAAIWVTLWLAHKI